MGSVSHLNSTSEYRIHLLRPKAAYLFPKIEGMPIDSNARSNSLGWDFNPMIEVEAISMRGDFSHFQYLI